MAASPLEIQPNSVYTLRDARQILLVSEATLQRWLKEGKILSARIARGYRRQKFIPMRVFLASQLQLGPRPLELIALDQ